MLKVTQLLQDLGTLYIDLTTKCLKNGVLVWGARSHRRPEKQGSQVRVMDWSLLTWRRKGLGAGVGRVGREPGRGHSAVSGVGLACSGGGVRRGALSQMICPP